MTHATFESALDSRIGEMLAACTKCGKCVEACPSVAPAGIAGAEPGAVVAGVLGIVRTGDGPEASRAWASSCTLSGACIEACGDGVNPRFLLAMARLAISKKQNALPERRRNGVARYRGTSQDVSVLSRIQLEQAVLERLGQGPASLARPGEPPDFVFYTGCNVLKTMGGPSHCCGIMQMRAGDMEMSARMGSASIDKLARSKSGQVLSWCPSCHVQLTETTLPTLARQGRAQPFEMTPFFRFLRSRLDQLQPLLRERVELRVALHKHPGVAGVVEAATDLLRAVPGIEVVELNQPAVGLQSVNLDVLPAYRRQLHQQELEAARDAGVDALVAIYHSDHRALCAHERNWPFRIVNILELLGRSMGLERHDRFKELKLLQDADRVVAECSDLIAQHALDPKLAREVVAKAMLGEQPLPLQR
jgi:Fe-S oxidoreductase